MTEYIIARNSGFCFGVKRAIQKAEDVAKHNDWKKIYTYGPLIHNNQVINDLKNKGIEIIEDLSETKPGDIVVIRSHGVGEKFYKDAKNCSVKLIDATCPFVGKIHELVKEALMSNKKVIIIGNANHPEVQGINGWCDNEAIILDGYNFDCINIDKDKDYFIVCQTTIEYQQLKNVENFLQKNNYSYIINNTICSATSDRQKEVEEIAQMCEGMIIIGGKNSSNTNKLKDIAKKYCKNVYFIENINDLPLQEISNYSRIGMATGASTPDLAVKEVISKMSESNTERNSMIDFMDEIEKSLKLPRVGEIVKGTIHQVSDNEIIVNLGCKKDGIIPKSELALEGNKTLTETYKVGDEIEAKVVKTDDGEGGILLSRNKLEYAENWKEITEALETKEPITVKIDRVVNGGVIGTYKNVSGFIPLSQLSDKYIENADEFVGKVMDVIVTRVDQRRNRAVFSHKEILMKERRAQLEKVWEKISEDDIVEGKVMRFTDYGAFVDLGGIDGLLHISEISWGKLKDPSEVLQIGDKVQVKILSINKEKGKIALGLKQTTPEPWSVIDQNYKVDEIVKGKVLQVKDYGAFVELEPGLDGLVHISEIAHKRVDKIEDELKVGQIVEAKILEIDEERKRISLSIKATLPEPEEPEEEKSEEYVEETDSKEEKIEETTETKEDVLEEKTEE